MITSQTAEDTILPADKQSYDRPLEYLFILYAAVLPVSISAANIALALIMLLGFYRLYQARINVWSLLDKKLALSCVALFGWAAIVALVRNGHIQKTDISNIWEYSPIVVFPLFLHVSYIRKEKVIFTLLLFASIVCSLGILQFVFPSIVYPFPKQPYRECFMGFQSHHLHAGGVYVLTSIIALSLVIFSENSRINKIVLWCFFFLNLTALVLTLARTYYVAIVFVFLFMFYIKGKKAMLLGVSMLAVSLILILSFQNNISDRINSILNSSHGSNRARLHIWNASLEMVKDYPLMGVGKSNWKEMARQYYFPKIRKKWRPAYGHAHNSYIAWLSETGIIGLCLFLCFWILSVKRLLAKQSLTELESVDRVMIFLGLFGLSSLSIGAFFEDNFETSIILLVIGPLIGLSLSVNRRAYERILSKVSAT